MGKPPEHKLRISVGIKVAILVIAFEGIMLAAYSILTNFFVDQEQLVEILQLEQQNFIIIVMASTLVLAGYLTFLVVTRIFSPVSILTHGTEEIIKGNLDLKIKLDTGDELEVLAERFNAMAAALKAERESLENKVRERTRALEEAQKLQMLHNQELLKLKDEFLFVAAHEIRTPVTSIRWSLESVADRKLPTAVKEAFDDSVRASKNLAALVEDLLNMARLDANRIEFVKEPVDVIALVKETVLEFGPFAEKKKIEVTAAISEDLTRHAVADARRLKEILMNLIGNAIKFNREDGHVTVSAGLSGDQIRISVEDDGPGIAPEEQKHLFEKFWRSQTQSGVEGTGLGLFITKRIVEGMNGKIAFESAIGKGTTFTVLLPSTK